MVILPRMETATGTATTIDRYRYPFQIEIENHLQQGGFKYPPVMIHPQDGPLNPHKNNPHP